MSQSRPEPIPIPPDRARVVPTVSVVVPMYDEADNAAATLAALGAALEADGTDYELIPVDDGSRDATWAVLDRLARGDPRIRPAHHPANRGRGAALRTGFEHARGRWVVTIDADLSYGPEHVPALLRALRDDPSLDLVIGSPYMPGGRAERVPWLRLWASRAGNQVLTHVTGQRFHTFTGILRGYRAAALRDLDLVSDGKEIHLEILSQAVALGWRVREVPAVLRARRAGVSKFKWRRTTASHLLHSMSERPLYVFGILGVLLLVLGLVVGGVIVAMWRAGVLNPERPLMTVLVLLVLGGVQLLAFGFIGTQVADLRRAVIRLQRAVRERNARDPENGPP